jgi:transcription initiation factor TFIIB
MATAKTSDTIDTKYRKKQESSEGDGCPECGERRFQKDTSTGEIYCRECGTLIDSNKIDTSKEYRVFDSEDKTKERVGSSITYTKADKGMKTKIGENSEIGKVSGKKRGQYYRLRKWDRRSDSDTDAVKKGLTILNRLSFELNLPESVKEEAGRLYEKCTDLDLIKGKEREAAVAALIYLVARNQELPRTQKEIAGAAEVKTRKMNSAYRNLARELDLDIRPAKPENFVNRYGSELELQGQSEARARRIVKEARDQGLTSGKNPVSVAAAGFYIGALLEGEEITQKRIADVTGVTSTTVRKTYRDLAEGLGLQEEIEEAKT